MGLRLPLWVLEGMPRELGPVDPDWFNVLTAKASAALEGNASDQEDLCANQEANFKTPLEKTTVESQLFSTPKVFRRACVLFPDTEDEQEKETAPWVTRSPYLFHLSKETTKGSKYGEAQPHTRDCFDLLHTPQKSPLSYAQHIPESLSAIIHPDISWTSSLNTPPALASTLILSKTDESPCSETFFDDKSVVFVRKLFPSLSNVSRNEATSPQSNDLSVIVEDADPPEVASHPESPKSNSQNQSEGIWRQKLPHGNEDEGICSTVANALERQENTPSVDLANTHLALRKVKADNTKTRQSILAKEHNSSSAESKPASIEQRESDVATALKSPVKSEEAVLTQWSPLSLSEIPATSVETNVATLQDASTAQVESQCKSDHPVRPSVNIPDSAFIKKKRAFVYTIDKERLKEKSFQGHNPHGKRSPQAKDEADFSSKHLQQGHISEEKLPPSHCSSMQDLDMSQLCRAFAHDFSQTSNSVAPPKVAQLSPPPLYSDGFSSSACLTALKVARQEAKRHASLSCVRKKSLNKSHEGITEEASGDSGFMSASADISHVTASSAFPSEGKPGPSAQCSTLLKYTSKELKTHIDGTLCTKDTPVQSLSCPKADGDNINCASGSVQFEYHESENAVSLPSIQASGFKTASDKRVSISSVNLQKDQSLLEETEAQTLLSDQTIKVPAAATVALGSGQKVDDCQLTDSQRAEVMELCTLLEDADSQFEFTQFRTAKSTQSGRGSGVPCPKADRKLDPNFLSGIDFDDSFEAEKQATNLKQSNLPRIPPIAPLPSFIETNDRTTFAFPSGIPPRGSTSKTAQGNLLRVSKKCLRKARALFQDLEESISTHQTNSKDPRQEDQLVFGSYKAEETIQSGFSPVKPVQHTSVSLENSAACPSGFQMASGKTVSISANAMLKANTFFKDCTNMDNNKTKRSVEDGLHLVGIDPLPKAASSSLNHGSSVDIVSSSSARFCTVSENKVSVSAKEMAKAKSIFQVDNKSTDSKKGSFPGVDPVNHQQCGFQTANGIRVAISSDALKKAKSLFDGIKDDVDIETKCSKNLAHSPPSMVCEFLSATGKQMVTSYLFDSVPVSTEKMDEKTGNATNVEKMDGCFSTASATLAGVRNLKTPDLNNSSLPTEVLQKADAYFRDMTESNEGLLVKEQQTKEIVQGDGFDANMPMVKGCGDIRNMEASSFNNKNESSTLPSFSPKNTRSCSVGDSGFHTASGKSRSVLDEAMLRARSLLDDVEKESQQQQSKAASLTSKEDILQSFGFQTAGGKRVSVSSAALKKAKSLFSDCEDQDEVSDNMLRRPNVSNTKSVRYKADSANETFAKAPFGFWTAGGKRVAISSAALKNANSLFSDCHEEDKASEKMLTTSNIENSQSVFCRANSTLHASMSNSSGLCTAIDKKDVVSDDAMTIATFMLDESIRVEDLDKLPYHKNVGFQTASGKGVAVSSAALNKAKSLLNDCYEDKVKATENMLPLDNSKHMFEPADLIPNVSLSNGGGFRTASGKKVFVSGDAVTRAKSLMNDTIMVEGLEKAQYHKNFGFQTASSKGVSVSSVPFNRGKSLFSDCHENEEKVTEKMSNVDNMKHAFDPADSTPLSSISSSSGFCTASKKLLVVDDSMTRANSVLNESIIIEAVDKAQYHKNVGFQTASGKIVKVSSAAMTKAKSVFSDCHEDEERASENMFVENPKPVFDPADSTSLSSTSGSGGFCTASKKLLVVDDAMTRANSVLNESIINEALDKAQYHKNVGFQTASGKIVEVSSAAVRKAKSVFSDCHEDEEKASENMFNVDNPKPVFDPSDSTPLSSTSSSGRFCTASKKLLVVDDAMTRANSVLNESIIIEALDKAQYHKNVGFQTASGKIVEVSSAAMKKAKSVFSDCHEDEQKASENMFNVDNPKPVFDQTDSTTLASTSSTGGFCTASKKVHVANDAMTKAKSVFDENIRFEALDKAQNQKNIGFQTASGKKVAVSSVALKKEKYLFSECHEDEDKHSDNMHNSMNVYNQTCVFDTADSTPHASTSSSSGFCPVSGKEVLVSDDAMTREKYVMDGSVTVEGLDDAHQHKDIGFKAASGKGVAISSAALHEAKLLLSEYNESQDEANDAFYGLSSTNCGFLAASGKPVTFSTESLQEAKALFDDISPKKDGLLAKTSNVKDVKITFQTPTVVGITEAMNTISKKEKPEAAEALNHKDGSLRGQQILEREISEACDRDTTEPQSFEGPAMVNFQSLDLSDCTETQQIFLAQEALDCTKALLEDETLAGPSMTLESIQPKNSFSCKAVGKRSAEDAELTDQPSLKRSLLGEFDRSVDSRRASRLCPQTSSPNGLLKDRPAFKYNVSLYPKITMPHRDGMSYMDLKSPTTTQHSSTAGGSRLTFPKIPSFVPPFFKRKDAQQSNVHKSNNANTPPAFVPPFKKQRTIVQQNSTKPYEEEEEEVEKRICAHLNSNTSNKADLPSRNPISNQTHSACHGAEENTYWSQEVMQGENIELARDMQHMRIRKKKRQSVRALPGSLFRIKTSGVTRIGLKEAVGGRPPTKYNEKQLYEYGVRRHVSQITSETAEAFCFKLQEFYNNDAFADEGAVQLADGGCLIPSRDGSAGKEQFYRALCDTPGVDPKLLSEEWVYNHYRWVVWKLASMERSFPQTMGCLCLTPERVLLQLKYRYDVEVDHSRRPALRKIMEKDDTAAKTIVLCVCGVVSQQDRGEPKTPQEGAAHVQVENQCAVVWLTDGWYAIKAQLDQPLSAMLVNGRLAVGGKIIVHGAQLVGSQEACSPLEAPESLMLKIFANSSRPARWDTKLGFYRDPRPFLLPLSSLYANGGPVGCVDIVVLRSYPIQWMERKQDGGVVFRSARAEEKEADRYNNHKQKAMEMLFAKIQAQFENEETDNKPEQRKRAISHQDVAGLQDGQELYETVGEDLVGLEAHLSEQQLETLQAYRRTLMEKRQADMQDRYHRALQKAEDGEASCLQRDVTPVWRLCVVDSLNPTGNIYQLNLWRPSSDLQAFLKEGCRYKLYNLTTSDGKKRTGVATVQLTGTTKTQFQDLRTSPEWLSTCFQSRVSANFVDLQDSKFKPLCGEVDLSGCIIRVIDIQGTSPAFYLADEKLNFVKVRCFSSLLQAGLADLVKPCALLALSNLQLRGQSIHPTPVVYAGDLSVFSANPKEAYLQESLSLFRNLLRDQDNFFLSAEEKLSRLLKSDGHSTVGSTALPPTTPTFASDNQHMKPKSQQPLRSLSCFTPVSRNLPPADSSTEKDPRSLKKRKALDFLSRVASPPPLFHLGPAASPALKKTFNPPRRSGTPSTLKTDQTHVPKLVLAPAEEEWVKDEELAMIDTQALRVCDSL
ncbi:breast cancer type 2 susceptibility protein isoform X2 [Nerophis ophidion]|uniref:breast cancer type 2 susceptibility protein isoform X2 n=1 Tax=Nerophis ophidion TaxID=159077 RepID=UPI002AE086AD|nr:breast cancer type 2 susceptibility protein isoform X2 [Nerophis ophidion]